MKFKVMSNISEPESPMDGNRDQDRSNEYLRMLNKYRLSTEEYLDRNYGPGTWTHDPYTDDYYVHDDSYRGPGRRFLVLDRELRCTPITVLVN
jgi:hypothetical protein